MPCSRRSPIVRLLLLLHASSCIARRVLKISFCASKLRLKVLYMLENMPAKSGGTGISVVKVIRDTILTCM